MAHEVAHGVVAEKLGDPTARLAGRLNLNPVNHIDLFGSIIFPALQYLTLGRVLLGWAKPVPYDPRNLPNPKIGAGLIAVAGPLTNICIALFFGLVIRFGIFYGISSELTYLFGSITLLNIGLAIFNLVPLPPLDGSKVLFAFLPYRWREVQMWLEQYGMFLLLAFIFFGFQLIVPLISFLFTLFTGLQ